MSSRVTVPVVLVLFVAVGFPTGTLGVAWLSIRADFHQPLAAIGQLLLVGTCGFLVGSSTSGFITDRFGTGLLLIGSALALAAGLALYAAATQWSLLLLGSFALGLGGGGVDAGANAYMALRHGPGLMNLMHACFGIGSAIGPILVTAALAAGVSWRVPYAGMAVVQVILLALCTLTRGAWGGRAVDRAEPAGPASKVPWVLLGVGMALFFVDAGVEIATGQWSFTFLVSARAVSTTVAGLAVSAYWGGMTAGRLGVALVGARVGPLPLLHVSVTATLAALALLWWSPLPAIGLVALTLVGVGLAPIFPALVMLTPRRVGEGVAARVVGVQMGAAGSGSAAWPAGIGLVLQQGGVGLLAPCLTVAGITLAALHVVATALSRGSTYAGEQRP